MAILKRRLDICGREKEWEYTIETAGRQYRVTARQVGHTDPEFRCSCGFSTLEPGFEDMFLPDRTAFPCSHVSEVQRDLNIARQAAAQMVP
jgi:hypothetical protein